MFVSWNDENIVMSYTELKLMYRSELWEIGRLWRNYVEVANKKGVQMTSWKKVIHKEERLLVLEANMIQTLDTSLKGKTGVCHDSRKSGGWEGGELGEMSDSVASWHEGTSVWKWLAAHETENLPNMKRLSTALSSLWALGWSLLTLKYLNPHWEMLPYQA